MEWISVGFLKKHYIFDAFFSFFTFVSDNKNEAWIGNMSIVMFQSTAVKNIFHSRKLYFPAQPFAILCAAVCNFCVHSKMPIRVQQFLFTKNIIIK